MARVHHAWNLSPKEAVRLQRQLADLVVVRAAPKHVKSVAGVDVSYKDGIATAAIVVLAYPDLAVLDAVVSKRMIDFPYIPGLLSFREVPPVLEAYARLSRDPDILIMDGHGVAHPRRLGLASHLGVLVDKPCIGCATKKLCGSYDMPGVKAGMMTELMDGMELLGRVVRTRTNVKPVFVSAGHRVSLKYAADLVLKTTRGRRLPEPTRLADRLAGGKNI